jgi:hypothetical protein
MAAWAFCWLELIANPAVLAVMASRRLERLFPLNVLGCPLSARGFGCLAPRRGGRGRGPRAKRLTTTLATRTSANLTATRTRTKPHGRTWDRTRDLPRVKQVRRFAAVRRPPLEPPAMRRFGRDLTCRLRPCSPSLLSIAFPRQRSAPGLLFPGFRSCLPPRRCLPC